MSANKLINLDKHIINIRLEVYREKGSDKFFLQYRLERYVNGETKVNYITYINSNVLSMYNLFSGSIRKLTIIVTNSNGKFYKMNYHGKVAYYYYFENLADANACIDKIISQDVLNSIVNN